MFFVTKRTEQHTRQHQDANDIGAFLKKKRRDVEKRIRPSLRVVRRGRLSPACRRQAHVGPASRRACEEARRRDSSELDRGNEAEETGRVRVNLMEIMISKETGPMSEPGMPLLLFVCAPYPDAGASCHRADHSRRPLLGVSHLVRPSEHSVHADLMHEISFDILVLLNTSRTMKTTSTTELINIT